MTNGSNVGVFCQVFLSDDVTFRSDASKVLNSKKRVYEKGQLFDHIHIFLLFY